MNRWYITTAHSIGSNIEKFGDFSEADAEFDRTITESGILYAQLHHEDGEVRRQFVRAAIGVDNVENT